MSGRGLSPPLLKPGAMTLVPQVDRGNAGGSDRKSRCVRPDVGVFTQR